MNTIDGADRLPATGEIFEHPLEFPAPARTDALRGSLWAEWPNPLAGCGDYTMPAGVPITLQIGSDVDAKLTAYSLVATSGAAAGTVEPACGFDATSYTNPERLAQDLARTVLRSFGEVVVVPRKPLSPGTQYRVGMTVNGKRYDWSFSTAP
jgi:hypothetical protein